MKSIIDILRKKMVGKIIGDGSGVNPIHYGSKIVDINIDNYEPYFNIVVIDSKNVTTNIGVMIDWKFNLI
mgnify:CR=1 FL=1